MLILKNIVKIKDEVHFIVHVEEDDGIYEYPASVDFINGHLISSEIPENKKMYELSSKMTKIVIINKNNRRKEFTKIQGKAMIKEKICFNMMYLLRIPPENIFLLN